jgi:hypothetical protein
VAGGSTESLGVMNRIQVALALSLVGVAPSLSAVELGPRQITTPSGSRYNITATRFMSNSTQSAIIVFFEVDDFDDLPKLKREAEEIYPLYIDQADRLKLNIIAVHANKPIVRSLDVGVSYGFVWARQPDNTWKFHESPKQAKE